MRIEFSISKASEDAFASSLEALILNVGNASRNATEQACQEILEDSLQQVPRDTGLLASTGFYEVQRNMLTKRYTYQGIVGYAGTAGRGPSYDEYNYKTGAAVSAYALRVHEDLDAKHPNGGKAKFLEDPVRAYGANRFKRVAETYWRYALDQQDSGRRLSYSKAQIQR